MVSTISWASPRYSGNEIAYVHDAVTSSWISGGPYIERFEAMMRETCHVDHALTCSNGTTALHLAYLGAGIQPGDEIILPNFAFMAAANIALHLHAVPVFAEVDPDTWCFGAEQVESLISEKTKAIVAIHTYGNLCDMDSLRELARQCGIFLLEDAAEGFPSRYKGEMAGSLGDISTFSFHATKPITCGEGGMVVTNDAAMAQRMALYRSHGMQRKVFYWHDAPGHNFRMTNMQAALGLAQAENLSGIIESRRVIHAQYTELLRGVEGLSLQRDQAHAHVVMWAFAVRLDSAAFPQGRDAVMQAMHDAGIETRPGFVSGTQLPYFAPESRRAPSYCTSELLAQSVLSLPSHLNLTSSQIEFIASTLCACRN